MTEFLPGVPVVKNSELPARGESLRDHIARFVIQNLRCFGFVFRERDPASSVTYIGFQDQRKHKTEIPYHPAKNIHPFRDGKIAGNRGVSCDAILVRGERAEDLAFGFSDESAGRPGRVGGGKSGEAPVLDPEIEQVGQERRVENPGTPEFPLGESAPPR